VSIITRRQALQAASVTCTTLGAGCTFLQGSKSKGTRIGRIEVLNQAPTAHNAHVLLLEGDEPVSWNSTEVDPFVNGELGGATFTGYPGDRGAYRLYAWVDDQPRSEWAKYDTREDDASCITLILMIHESEAPESAVISIHIEHDCDDRETNKS